MDNDLDELIKKFIRIWATFNPFKAFEAGLREYGGLINSITSERLEHYIYSLHIFEKKLKVINYELLSEKDKLEYLLLNNKISLELFNIVDLDVFHTNPMKYLDEALIFDYILKDYAPLNQRIEQLSIHLNHLPQYFEQALKNLNKNKLSFELVEMAHLMISGLISFFNNLENEIKDISFEKKEDVSETIIKNISIKKIEALNSLKRYDSFLENILPYCHASFRLGKEKFLKMLKDNERVENVPLERLVECCEINLNKNLKIFDEVAKKIDPNATTSEIIKKIQKNHPSKDALLEETRNVLSDIKEYSRKLVDIPSEAMPKVILTPKPYRPWAFAIMDHPGPLETFAKDSYYYVTPPDDDWPADQQEEWLQTFNYKELIDVSIHECFPGHYLHHLYNQRSSYLLPKLFGAYHFIEGYAVHIEEEMWEIGFHKGDYEYRMTQLLETLLRNVRMLVSIKLHTTTDFTIEEGVQLFMKYAHLGRKPAESEAKRGTYDPGYLNYCLGKLMIEKLKDDYKKEKGLLFNNREFYKTLLSFGSPPVPILRKFMLKNKEILNEIL